MESNCNNSVTFHFTPETIRSVTYEIVNAKTLEGFGVLPEANEQLEDVKTVTNKDKLVASLTNQVEYSQLYNNEMSHFCWQSLADVDISLLSKIIGKN
ncbi:unnamed protein product [Rotaria magnacalcarata]|uniref:Uncharacterized protein n=1 Tax=Rotaria magnacalcarata TaxID=392030 RepID=A0A820QDS1_9BILA|nr:unnamed protein product [Rotaria magnacalcarata]